MEINYGNDYLKNVTFREGVTQLTSAGLNSQKLSLEEISEDDSDIWLMYHNFINGPLEFIRGSVFQFSDRINWIEDAPEKKFINISNYLGIVLSFCIMLISILLMKIRYQRQDELIKLFYGFRAKDSKVMTQRLDDIINGLYLSEDFAKNE
jgi:hypothetical protein